MREKELCVREEIQLTLHAAQTAAENPVSTTIIRRHRKKEVGTQITRRHCRPSGNKTST